MNPKPDKRTVSTSHAAERGSQEGRACRFALDDPASGLAAVADLAATALPQPRAFRLVSRRLLSRDQFGLRFQLHL